MTYAEVRVINPRDEGRYEEVRILVDTGALYTVLPKDSLLRIGVGPTRRRAFALADGRKIERQTGEAVIECLDEKATSVIVFGEEKDMPVMGVQTLEGLGLEVDPNSRQLRPGTLYLLSSH